MFLPDFVNRDYIEDKPTLCCVKSFPKYKLRSEVYIINFEVHVEVIFALIDWDIMK